MQDDQRNDTRFNIENIRHRKYASNSIHYINGEIQSYQNDHLLDINKSMKKRGQSREYK